MNGENFEKLLDKAEQIFGKRDNFTIDDVVKYFVEVCGGKAYKSLQEMERDKDVDLTYILDDLKIYTDYNKNLNKCMSFIVPTKDKSDEDWVWVIYDKDKRITSFFSESAYEECKILSVMCKDWRERREKWLNDRMEYEKTHTLEGDLKELLGESYSKRDCQNNKNG